MASDSLHDQVPPTSPEFLAPASVGSKRPAIALSPEVKNRRKDPKTSRACDVCKRKKIRCDGALPCKTCAKRKLSCAYTAKYARGRPPTPAQSTLISSTRRTSAPEERSFSVDFGNDQFHPTAIPSRTSPEAELEGQYFDPTSGFNFLHRAWKKLFSGNGDAVEYGSNDTERRQLLTSAGDRPFDVDNGETASNFIPDASACRALLEFYFNTCVVTYCMFHRKTIEGWLEAFSRDRAQEQRMTRSLGNSRCAILLTIMAIATLRQAKVTKGLSLEGETADLQQSDRLFCSAVTLTETEMGFPRLESVQARLIQVLYLLQTSRMNKAWYTFGNVFHITLSLGMHRRQDYKRDVPFSSRRLDYISLQSCKRTFWVAYIIDRYLSVVFGRPRLYQDEDIDQDFPDSVNDEEMTPQGPLTSEDSDDCYVDGLIMHAKYVQNKFVSTKTNYLPMNRIARIIGKISREVYTVSDAPTHDRAVIAHHLRNELQEWHSNLPPHLGTVKPSTLIPSFRRQAIALQLAYSHAIIHVNRPFLLGDEREDRATECINAAKASLELVDRMASDSTLFHSFWWTQYVTFCALAVVYVSGIQQKRRNVSRIRDDSQNQLFGLAERCRSHLVRATTGPSPSRKYNIILEELRLEAQLHEIFGETSTDLHDQRIATNLNTYLRPSLFNTLEVPDSPVTDFLPQDDSLDTWQIMDWLALDSSVCFCFEIKTFILADILGLFPAPRSQLCLSPSTVHHKMMRYYFFFFF